MSRYTPTEVPLDLIAGDQLELAAEHGEPVTIKVKVGGYRAMLPMTKAQIDKLKKGGKSIRLTPAHLRYLKGRGLCGRGVFTDLGKAAGPAIGSAVGTAISAIPGVGAAGAVIGPILGEAISGLTGSIGKAIDTSIEKKKFNEQQSAKNFNSAISKAQAFLAMSDAEQRAQYDRLKKIPMIGNRIGTFDDYYAKMAAQSKASTVTPEQQLSSHLAKKGLGKRGMGKKKDMSGKRSTTVGKLASEYIQAALSGQI